MCLLKATSSVFAVMHFENQPREDPRARPAYLNVGEVIFKSIRRSYASRSAMRTF